MSKHKFPGRKPRIPLEPPKSVQKPAQTPGGQSRLPSAAAVRETIESIVIAFVLAFLFRAFEAEAFVIPTGSMAPTLMGRHKDLACPKCSYPYQAGASEEVDENEVLRGAAWRVAACTCPMCRYTYVIDVNRAGRSTEPSYSGDRIIVDKLAYEFQQPQRWDVVVFRYPNVAWKNYIKRLVGLPGEKVRIQYGDIWVQRGDEDFRLVRKPPRKLLAMLQPVFDNDYMPHIARHGWPERWTPDGSAPEAGVGWRSEDKASFSIAAQDRSEHWLRYHHRVPSFEQWRRREENPRQPIDVPASLITDFTAYDTSRTQAALDNFQPGPEQFGLHWVGDLALECTVESHSPQGTLILELCKGGREFQCRFDLTAGKAELRISGAEMSDWRPAAVTPLGCPGRHELRFANCDNELLLWVDEKLVSFDAPTTYPELNNRLPKQSDLAPAGVGVVGAALTVSHLRLKRDIYYIAMDYKRRKENRPISDYEWSLFFNRQNIEELPWGKQPAQSAEFSLGEDQFLMLGDNSANSLDGRLWGPEHWVKRELLIGKALFIYWPHSWHKIPYINIPCPYFPNFARMGLVR